MAAKKGPREKRKIKTVSYAYVGSKENRVPVSELTPEQRQRLGTWIKKTYLNNLYAGKAVFFEAGEVPPV